MSTVNHKPATALPWKRSTVFPTFIDAEHTRVCEVYYGGDSDIRAKNATYIAHAANAYPKFVERTQRRISWLRSVRAALPDDIRPMYDEAMGAEIASDEALLRKLGEEA